MKNADKPINPIVQEENIGQGGKILMCTEYGLTKREHYAGLALQGIIAGRKDELYKIKDETIKIYVELSIKSADELLKQLEKK